MSPAVEEAGQGVEPVGKGAEVEQAQRRRKANVNSYFQFTILFFLYIFVIFFKITSVACHMNY